VGEAEGGQEVIMKRLAGVIFLFTVTGCDSDRLAKLEKQNTALGEQLAALQKSSQLESQSKCAKDSREWFGREWSADKDTLLLNYTNHYSGKLNKCFISVAWNYGLGLRGFTKSMLVYDVYENAKVAEWSETHMMIGDKTQVQSGLCSVAAVKCASFDEFSARIQPYTNQ
jgi:hypothetical protein